ncbi:hypothetical protein BBP40_003260 [Aspergillus hancockii]|nr:hypothetical protein BBP40_003260 [Aspergillus hancockii]
MFFLLVNETEYADVIQKTTGDWINLAQLAAVWILWLLLFLMGLYYPSDRQSRQRKVSASIMYILLLLVSIVPVVADAIDYYFVSSEEDAYRNWGLDFFGEFHYSYIHPVMTLVGIYAYFPQERELRSRAQLPAFSQTGLAAQAVIFSLVAISWTMRIKLYDSTLPDLPVWATVPEWYKYVWWAAVDNMIFAGIQIGLYFKTRHQERPPIDGETQPLLPDDISGREE